MTPEQLKKGKEISKKIDDLQLRIEVLGKVNNGTASVTEVHLGVHARIPSEESGSYVNTANFGTNYRKELTDEQFEAVKEEILLCSERIVRIYEKEIKRLEKEFASL